MFLPLTPQSWQHNPPRDFLHAKIRVQKKPLGAGRIGRWPRRRCSRFNPGSRSCSYSASAEVDTAAESLQVAVPLTELLLERQLVCFVTCGGRVEVALCLPLLLFILVVNFVNIMDSFSSMSPSSPNGLIPPSICHLP